MKKFNIEAKQINDFLEEKVKKEFIDTIGSNLEGYHQDIFINAETNELYITDILSQGDIVETDDKYITELSSYTELNLEIYLEELIDEKEQLAVLEKINAEEHKNMTLEELKNREISEIYEELYPEGYEEKKEEWIEDKWSFFKENLFDIILDKINELNKN